MLFPPPVGNKASTSCPERAARTMSSCIGRKAAWPQVFCKISSGSAVFSMFFLKKGFCGQRVKCFQHNDSGAQVEKCRYFCPVTRRSQLIFPLIQRIPPLPFSPAKIAEKYSPVFSKIFNRPLVSVSDAKRRVRKSLTCLAYSTVSEVKDLLTERFSSETLTSDRILSISVFQKKIPDRPVGPARGFSLFSFLKIF